MKNKNFTFLLHHLKLFTFFCLVTVLFACRKEFVIDYADLPKKLVVNCLFTTDSIFSVQVTKLQQFTDTTNGIITNARVTILENNNAFETLKYDTITQKYLSTRKAQTENTYTIQVEAEGFPVATATDKIPAVITIDSANVYIGVYYDSHEEYKLDGVEFFFKEPIEENYYEVLAFNLMPKDIRFPWINDRFSLANYITSIDVNIQKEGIFDTQKYQPVLIFNDKLLTENAKISFMPFLQLGTGGVGFIQSYTLLRNISKDYYLFRKQWYKHLQGKQTVQMNGIGQLTNMSFIAEPVEAYTNVKNGLGIFAAYTQTTKRMKIQ